MRLLLTLPLLFSFSQCGKDETLTGYGAADVTWRLAEIDGAAFSATATVTFPEEGKIAGKAPCNSFTATQTQPYPWFEAKDIAATRRACPDLDQETAFLTALSEMTLAEVSSTTLLLSTPDGREMVFQAEN